MLQINISTTTGKHSIVIWELLLLIQIKEFNKRMFYVYILELLVYIQQQQYYSCQKGINDSFNYLHNKRFFSS